MKKRKFESYVGSVPLDKIKKQKKWVSKASDWELIDAIEHKWLHKLPRAELEALANNCSLGITNQDFVKLEEKARDAQKQVLDQADVLNKWHRVIHFLKAANRTFFVKFDNNINCPVLIESVLVKHNWTPIDFPANHVHKAQQVPCHSYDYWEDGDRCECRDDAKDSVHPSVDGHPIGSAPLLFKVKVLESLKGRETDFWHKEIVPRPSIDKGTIITLHLRKHAVRWYYPNYDDPQSRIYISLEDLQAQVEPELWMNENLGFCPVVWKLVMEYTAEVAPVPKVMCGTCGRYPQDHDPQGCTSSSDY